jgi:hypothetical protein
MKKIQCYEGAMISIDGGYATIHIAEASENTDIPDKAFQIDLSETVENMLYLGIPFTYGKRYFSWKAIVQTIQRSAQEGKIDEDEEGGEGNNGQT